MKGVVATREIDPSYRLPVRGLFPLPPITASVFGQELLPAMVIPNIGGWVGGLLTRTEVEGAFSWYERLKKPSWRPPNWAFGPVWTTLYCGMGAASWMVWRQGGGLNGVAKVPLLLYGSSLALNWAWSPVFFKLHQTGWGLGIISALWLNVAACIGAFYPINKVASYLMVPYLAWLSLATALNFCIWRDNPKADKM
ncbi:translocator protein-like [Paramacrobiotus metropolitanus]|uniref:translocator protein-like n=1 Tax=Paramacrobiotus metropolitanus TaxID=2943436 RepID=UPI002445E33A|nr:translocator protein-like [Paramacrobiotus metropolitanus]